MTHIGRLTPIRNVEKAMNWDAIRVVGELVGSLTVALTVAYLQIKQAVQIKQSSKVASSKEAWRG